MTTHSSHQNTSLTQENYDDLIIPVPPISDAVAKISPQIQTPDPNRAMPTPAPVSASAEPSHPTRPNMSPQTGTPSPKNESICWAFTSVGGGAGTTTLCIQSAIELNRMLQSKTGPVNGQTEPQICLIDLDFENGTCAQYLDLTPGLQISDLQAPPERIDRALTQAFVSTHDSGIAVLATPNTLAGNDKVNPATVLALLDKACEIYPYVILDIPQIWRPWTHAAIGGADKLGLLIELTIPALHQARARIAQIEDAVSLRATPEVILTKYERRSFRNTLRLKDANLALKREISLTICVDNESVKEALNCGEAVSSVRPEARYVKDVRKLVATWTQTDTTSNVKFLKPSRKRAATV